jgi:hypothetical protein
VAAAVLLLGAAACRAPATPPYDTPGARSERPGREATGGTRGVSDPRSGTSGAEGAPGAGVNRPGTAGTTRERPPGVPDTRTSDD